MTDKKNKIETTTLVNYEDEIKENKTLNSLFTAINFIISCSCKGSNSNVRSLLMTNDIINTVRKFKQFHNKNFGGYFVMKAQNYGSSAHVYVDTSKIIVHKVYNYDLRWSIDGHSDFVEIFERELKILDRIKYENISCKILARDKGKRILRLTYAGESLYDNFHLPKDWKIQIREIFDILTKYSVVYREFNIKNILVKDNRIYFVDFGLAYFGEEGNEDNLVNFIEILDILDNRFKCESRTNVLILYDTFINNMKLEGRYSRNLF